jgi:hypothetical protein
MFIEHEQLWIEHIEVPKWVYEIDDLETRLEHYSKGKRELAEDVERALLANDLEKALTLVKYSLQRKANSYGRKRLNYWLDDSDFESAFWEESRKIVGNFCWTGGYGKFLLYETLLLSWDREAIDVIKKATRTYKGRVFHTALPLSDEFEKFYPDPNVNIEETVTNKLVIEQFMKEQAITPKERMLLQTMIAFPGSTLRELASMLNLNKNTISRMHAKIGEKFKQFNDYAEGMDESFLGVQILHNRAKSRGAYSEKQLSCPDFSMDGLHQNKIHS